MAHIERHLPHVTIDTCLMSCHFLTPTYIVALLYFYIIMRCESHPDMHCVESEEAADCITIVTSRVAFPRSHLYVIHTLQAIQICEM